MSKFPFPMPPAIASLTGAVLASSVLILGLDILEIQLWWLELMRDIDRATGWSGLSSPNDWVYLFENRNYAAFHKVNSFFLLATLIFIVTTVANWVMIVFSANLQIVEQTQNTIERLKVADNHASNLSDRLPTIDEQAYSAWGNLNGVASEVAAIKKAASPSSGPSSQPITSEEEGSSSHDLARKKEKELEPAPKRKLEEKEKENDIDLEFDR